jgi:hypothetical protein
VPCCRDVSLVQKLTDTSVLTGIRLKEAAKERDALDTLPRAEAALYVHVAEATTGTLLAIAALDIVIPARGARLAARRAGGAVCGRSWRARRALGRAVSAEKVAGAQLTRATAGHRCEAPRRAAGAVGVAESPARTRHAKVVGTRHLGYQAADIRDVLRYGLSETLCTQLEKVPPRTRTAAALPLRVLATREVGCSHPHSHGLAKAAQADVCISITCSPVAHCRLRSGESRAGIGYTAGASAERNGATSRACALESYCRMAGARAERPNLSLAILPKKDLRRPQR